MSIFSIGTSALSAAYTALRTAGNNVANANTPGYTRQTAVLAQQAGAQIGGLFVGQGVSVADIRRNYDDFLSQQAHSAQAAASQADTRQTLLDQVSNLFADTGNGIGSRVDQFFKSIQDLTQRPADPAARQSLLSSANSLTQRFNDLGNRLQTMRTDTDTQLRREVDTVNTTAKQIAVLNDQIALARGAGHPPNDLLDQRDVAIRKLNESVRVTGVAQDDGAINLFLANGQPLVVGNKASSMGFALDKFDPQSVRVGAVDAAGNVIGLDPAQAGGGRIGALLQFRANDLPLAENELGRMATTMAAQFNQQHRLGNDRNGNAGGDFFSSPTITSYAAGTNASAVTASATFTDTTALQASDYRLDYTGGQYQLTRMSDGTKTTSAAVPITSDGVSFTLSGTPANGDVFMFQPVRNASRTIATAVVDPNQIAAANPVKATLPATNVGTLTIDDLSVVGPTRNANLTQTVAINFTGPTTYTYTIAGVTSAAQTYTSGTPITLNGWSLTVRGTPQNGDALTVSANAGGVGDNRNALKLAGLQTLSLVNGGTLADVGAQVVARVGAEAQGAQTFNAAQSAILKDALDAESSVSGVNLDEEASRLLQYQQQYQAAAKVLTIANTIFDSILNLAR